jgi:YD repeat-containing protein
MTFAYPTNQLVVTDSLNRIVTVTTNPGVTDTITFKGAGGVNRTITVTWSSLSAALMPGLTVQSCGVLFPQMIWGEAARCFPAYNPKVVSSVTLPNGLQYVFRYNAYNELARVTLPTGGRLEYTWGRGSRQRGLRAN